MKEALVNPNPLSKLKSITALSLFSSFAIYIPAALLMFIMTHYLIPFLSKTTEQEPVLFWFIVGGLGIFGPLIITGLIILQHEGYKLNKKTWNTRLRFRKLNKRDWLWGVGGLVIAGSLSGVVMKMIEIVSGPFDHSPAFMAFEPLSAGRYWLLLIWLPYWILNIMGEEFLWRGVMMPRQEIAFKKYTWIIHAVGWSIFHIAFGWQLLLTLIPLMFIQSYAVQRTKNSWVGVIMHGGLNGPSFIVISFGLI